MPYAITQTCCSDATCVSVCPVNCIHPTPQEREFGSTEMLYVDPSTCIDCGACADACPVDAILPVDRLRGPETAYADINAAYFDTERPAPADPAPNLHAWERPAFDRGIPSDFAPLRVAVVGSGPAGMYAAEDLLLHTGSRVTLLDRLPEPGGLVRYGVAPDHPSTKKAGEAFARVRRHPRLDLHTGVQVGTDLTHEELLRHHDAVVYAVGASGDRRLGIAGEELENSIPATRFVAWYNGHPEVPPDAFELSAERVVVVGTGNVALDVARMLLTDPESLATTEVAGHALDALRASKVREVVLVGRRGPEHAAYSTPEMLALKQHAGVDVLVDDHAPSVGEAIDGARRGDKAAILQGVRRERIDWSAEPPAGRRLVLRLRTAPAEVLGDISVRAVRTTAPTGDLDIPTGLLLRSIGYRGEPVAGLPFDPDTATVPNASGRVVGMPGTYVVGWTKRGPSGGIGANRTCSAETVSALLADAVYGTLPTPSGSSRAFRRLLRRR